MCTVFAPFMVVGSNVYVLQSQTHVWFFSRQTILSMSVALPAFWTLLMAENALGAILRLLCFPIPSPTFPLGKIQPEIVFQMTYLSMFYNYPHDGKSILITVNICFAKWCVQSKKKIQMIVHRFTKNVCSRSLETHCPPCYLLEEEKY